MLNPSDRAGSEPVQASGSYRAWQLDQSHRAVVDLAWHSWAGHSQPTSHQLLPFTEPSIALRRRFDTSDTTTDWDFVIFRAQIDGGAYDPQPGEELFALRLAPEIMETSLRMKASDYLDQDCQVPRVLSGQFEGAARLADSGDFVAAWRMMLRVFANITEGAEPDRISLAAGLARRSSGLLGPAQLAERAGLSTRHMRRGFANRLGLSPRAILRRQRLTTAMLEAERCVRPVWADIAATFSFADQAHMIRECRALMGQSPGEWHRQRRNMAVSFNT